jgi:hypothetical protein
MERAVEHRYKVPSPTGGIHSRLCNFVFSFNCLDSRVNIILAPHNLFLFQSYYCV